MSQVWMKVFSHFDFPVRQSCCKDLEMCQCSELKLVNLYLIYAECNEIGCVDVHLYLMYNKNRETSILVSQIFEKTCNSEKEKNKYSKRACVFKEKLARIRQRTLSA